MDKILSEQEFIISRGNASDQICLHDMWPNREKAGHNRRQIVCRLEICLSCFHATWEPLCLWDRERLNAWYKLHTVTRGNILHCECLEVENYTCNNPRDSSLLQLAKELHLPMTTICLVEELIHAQIDFAWAQPLQSGWVLIGTALVWCHQNSGDDWILLETGMINQGCMSSWKLLLLPVSIQTVAKPDKSHRWSRVPLIPPLKLISIG